MNISDRQRKHLRTLAHPRKPVVTVGRNGLTENVMAEIESALAHHELVKVRVSIGDRTQRDETVSRICELTKAELVQRIGHIATLYLPNPENPAIDLP